MTFKSNNQNHDEGRREISALESYVLTWPPEKSKNQKQCIQERKYIKNGSLFLSVLHVYIHSQKELKLILIRLHTFIIGQTLIIHEHEHNTHHQDPLYGSHHIHVDRSKSNHSKLLLQLF